MTTAELTARQTQVLVGLADGQTIDEIAAALYVSRDTVKQHMKITYRKLDASNAAEAFRAGLVT